MMNSTYFFFKKIVLKTNKTLPLSKFFFYILDTEITLQTQLSDCYQDWLRENYYVSTSYCLLLIILV